MIRRRLLVLAWWFFFTIGHSGGIAGPFDSASACETTRIKFEAGSWWLAPRSTEPCVDDTKPTVPERPRR